MHSAPAPGTRCPLAREQLCSRVIWCLQKGFCGWDFCSLHTWEQLSQR